MPLGVERKLNECEFKKHVHCAPFMKIFLYNDRFTLAFNISKDCEGLGLLKSCQGFSYCHH